MITWKSLVKDCIGGHEYKIFYDGDTLLGVICKHCNNTITIASYIYQKELLEWQRSVGPGWAPLIEQAVAFLKTRGVNITDIKEKYGALLIFTDYYDDEVIDFIETISWRSMHICEECGRPGKIRQTGWVKTLCFQHYIGSRISKVWFDFKYHFLIPRIVDEVNKFFEEKNNENRR